MAEQSDRRTFTVTVEAGSRAEGLLDALREAGAGVTPAEETPAVGAPPVAPGLRAAPGDGPQPLQEERPRFEGSPFRDPNGFVYDSRAARLLTRWAQAIATGTTGRRRLDRLERIADQLMEAPMTDVVLGNPEFEASSSAFTLEDGSRLVLTRSGLDLERDTYSLFRLTGQVTQGDTCWLDWGYDPPVASTRLPLPGNMKPPVPSLEIG